MDFSSLGLSPKVLAAVAASGYVTPTPIQAQGIPHVLARRDVVGIAQTGTGKTASFVLPMLTMLEQGRARARMPRTLILEPTRELAAQVEESFNRYGQNLRLTVALIIGGVSFGDQEKKLDRGVDVLIATPGRLLDLFERGKLLLSGVEILVIDEADRMLDMGFIPDIERIIKLLPFTRQTLFFSATMPPEIQRLADNFLSSAVRVEVSRPASTVATVTQKFLNASRDPAEKRALLRACLRQASDLRNAIIFCNRKRDVAVLARSLERHGFLAGGLHGDMDQRARMAMLDGFRGDKIKILVASDVAARGLDIPEVSHVVNFDVPIHAEDYVHRIGRTGRAGRTGTAITLATPADRKYVEAIAKLTGDTPAWAEAPPDAPAASAEASSGESASIRDRGRDRRPRRGRGGENRVERLEPAPVAPAGETPAAGRARDRRTDQGKRADRPADRAANAPSREGSDARRSGRQGRQEAERNNPGLGEHVPQFLLRPVRLPS
ncbi:MAG: DEAD/DEAH box helicase [Bauldia sp.]